MFSTHWLMTPRADFIYQNTQVFTFIYCFTNLTFDKMREHKWFNSQKWLLWGLCASFIIILSIRVHTVTHSWGFKNIEHSWVGTSSAVGRGLRWNKAGIPAGWGEVALICSPGMRWHKAGLLCQELCWQWSKLTRCFCLSASVSCWVPERCEMEQGELS